MTAESLSAPLQPGGRGTKSTLSRIIKYAGTGLVVLGTTGAFAGVWMLLSSNKMGGEPQVRLALDDAPPQVARGEGGEAAALPIRNTLQPDDRAQGSDGRFTQLSSSAADDAEDRAPAGVAVVRHLGGEINKTSAPGQRPDRSSPLRRVPDPALVEKGKYGPLPRIGSKGRRPSDVYARPPQRSAALGPGQPAKIAIMIGGLGISASVTADAITKLPAAVSLAFAPYGRDLQRWVSRARQSGHETLLQLPMEPFDYPDNDPGPHTLLSKNSANENVERLHWLMSRITGYFGVTNYMGAKFTSASQALNPVLRELSQRGLAYVDDGTSSRSVAATAGESAGMRTATSDMVIDLGQTKPSIDAALKQLEQLALQRGFALASGTAFPATIERLTLWAKGLKSRGIVLVPVSAAIGNQPES